MKLKQFNFKRVKSTNQTAIRLIKKNVSDFGLVISETQSKGRGQYGKKWISLKGNIFLSFFFRLDEIKLPFNFLTRKKLLFSKKYYFEILQKKNYL